MELGVADNRFFNFDLFLESLIVIFNGNPLVDSLFDTVSVVKTGEEAVDVTVGEAIEDTSVVGDEILETEISSLDFASLDFASLDFASLDFASLDFVSLDFVSLDAGTFFLLIFFLFNLEPPLNFFLI